MHAALCLGAFLPPGVACCLQLRSGAASPLQWSPSLPGSAALKGGLLNSDKSPKWKAGWWFQYFSKRDFQVKDFCFAKKTVLLAFQIPLLIPQFLQQYQPQEENKVTGRLTGLYLLHIPHRFTAYKPSGPGREIESFWNRELSLWKQSCTSSHLGALERGADKAGLSLRRLVKLSMKRTSKLLGANKGA